VKAYGEIERKPFSFVVELFAEQFSQLRIHRHTYIVPFSASNFDRWQNMFDMEIGSNAIRFKKP
jgi:hypothetical protein